MKSLATLNPFHSRTWDPLHDIGEMENRLEQFFGRPARTTNGNTEQLTVAQWSPAVDIVESDKEYLIKAELPELKKEDLKVTVEHGELTITGERKFEKEEKNKKYHRVERSFGSFLRTFILP